MKKLVVFVDGQNFFYTLQNLGLSLENINLQNFFSHLIDKSHLDKNKIELIRVSWYQVRDVFPQTLEYKILRNYISNDCSRNPNSYQFKQHEVFEKDNTGNFKIDLNSEMEKRIKWIEEQNKKIRFTQDKSQKVALEYPRIEFVKIGNLKVNPYAMEIKGEKGVDVGIAVDLIQKSDYFDIAFIISGDADLSPAIKHIKDKLKLVYITRFFKGHPPTTRGSSEDIRTIADEVIDLYTSEFESAGIIIK